ncbi:MAG: ribose-phosphate pyrophosphokinase [Deltaproteobacteria bacterium]|nr:ribose-phosphate pyrophosphokinase [Deltaproteobacteria bacterium]
MKLVFATRSYAYLADALCALGFQRGTVEQKQFPDGERYQRIVDDVRARDVVLVGGTISDSDTMELYDAACALAKYGSHTLTIVIPYFGYATMERAMKAGEVVTAKTRARLLSSIPPSGAGTRVLMVDLHVDAITYYFEGHVRPFHVYAKPIVLRLAKELAGTNDFVLACTDAGRAKWVESLANDLSVSASFVFKRRIDDRKTEVAAVSAQVQGKRVVIYDDMIRTGSSLLKAAQAYRDAGAADVSAIATHGVFPEDALQKITASGLISKLACTDSHPRARALAGPQLRVESLAPLLAEHLRDEVG